ncbi:hypothetical protein F5Y13DRAFT_26453 [Hypoxylon sp. FL1857]|nr:hypothetical protein F5Y13DRAFT_26453 [Hypoxylon sp. FL1857]
MASPKENRKLRRSVSATLSSVPPMFRRLFSRRRSLRRGAQDRGMSPFVSDDELPQTPNSEAQFDKRCVVTFESGRGTIRQIPQIPVPEPRTPRASSEGLVAEFQDPGPSSQRSAKGKNPARPLSFVPPTEYDTSWDAPDTSTVRGETSGAGYDEVRQHVFGISHNVHVLYDELCERFERIEAQLNYLETQLEESGVIKKREHWQASE